MLVLTRRAGESIMIGDGITVTILSITGNQVRVGVAAPAEVAVHREEIYERIQKGISALADKTIRLPSKGGASHD